MTEKNAREAFKNQEIVIVKTSLLGEDNKMHVFYWQGMILALGELQNRFSIRVKFLNGSTMITTNISEFRRPKEFYWRNIDNKLVITNINTEI